MHEHIISCNTFFSHFYTESAYKVKNYFVSFERPLREKKNGVFLFVISSSVPDILKFLHYAN